MAESGWAGGYIKYVLLGVGVNLNNPVPHWLPDATSLSKELGEMVDVDAFLHRLLETLDLYLLRMESDPELILSSWRESSLTLGKMVCVADRSGEMISGNAVDVELDGSLIVDCGSEIKKVVSGVLEFR